MTRPWRKTFFATMGGKQRLEIVPIEKEEDMENAKVQKPEKLFQFIRRMEFPELCYEERLDVAGQLHKMLGMVNKNVSSLESRFGNSLSSKNMKLVPVLFS